VLAHLCNRTTAQERASYHISETYAVKEAPVPYGALRLPETDIYGEAYRALPPAEHMVLVAWYRNDARKRLAEADDGFVYVRLGRRSGALRVHPNLSRARQALLRTDDAVVAPGLLLLREPGFRVYTRAQLRAELQQHAGVRGIAAWEASAAGDDEAHIYALFRTRRDPVYAAQEWDGDQIMDLIEAFESDARNTLVTNLGRTSAYPRILPLRALLKTARSNCDSCFWHGCPRCYRRPASNRAYWDAKVQGNRARDRMVNRALRRAGWRVLRIWEHELSVENEGRLLRRLRRNLLRGLPGASAGGLGVRPTFGSTLR
jgi:hypothetical protein